MKYFLNNVRSLRLYISALFLTSAILFSYGFAQDAAAPDAQPAAQAEETVPDAPAESAAAEESETPADSVSADSAQLQTPTASPEPSQPGNAPEEKPSQLKKPSPFKTSSLKRIKENRRT